MNKKVITVLSVLVIVVFIVYMILDVSRSEGPAPAETINFNAEIPDAWMISTELAINEGSLKAVAAASDGNVFVGGDSFVSCYDKDLKLSMEYKNRFCGNITLCFRRYSVCRHEGTYTCSESGRKNPE